MTLCTGCESHDYSTGEPCPNCFPGLSDDDYSSRFDLYGALWAFCSRWHSGQGSRGYRILSKLERAQYSPGLGLQQGRFESEEQAWIYRELLAHRHTV